MTKALTGSIVVSIGMNYANVVGGTTDTDAQVSLARKLSQAIASGVGLNQADVLWFDENRTLGSGSSEDINMYSGGSLDIGAGAGKDPLGIAMTNARIKGLIVVNNPTSAGTLQVGPKGDSSGWTPPWFSTSNGNNLPPGGMLVLTAPTAGGYAVTNTTNMNLHINANGGAATYSIYFVGADA